MIKHETTYKEGRPNNPVRSVAAKATTEIKDATNTDTGRRGQKAYVCVVDGPRSAAEGDSDIQVYGTGCHEQVINTRAICQLRYTYRMPNIQGNSLSRLGNLERQPKCLRHQPKDHQ
jgi:hypothetical protein